MRVSWPHFIIGKILLPKQSDGARLPANMDASRSSEPTAGSALNNVQAAPQARIDTVTTTVCAVLAVFVGWFLLNTLVVTLGSIQHGVRFFDVSAVIADPTRIFFGLDTPVQRVFFGLFCAACLMAPLLSVGRRSRAALAGYFAPLVLMVLCGALLYWRTSGDFFQATTDPSNLASSVIRLANDLVHRGSGLVARHISAGVGAYLAFAGSLVLAVRGVRRLRDPTI